MALKLITAPTENPISLLEAQDHLRLNGITGNDDRINRAIAAATDYVEKYTGRALCTQTWMKYVEVFPCIGDEIRIEKAPVTSISSVKYLDINGALQTVSSSDYDLDAQSEAVYIRPVYGYSWPDTYVKYNAVQVTFVCGYGAAATVPASIRAAILLLTDHYFRNTSAVNLGAAGISNDLSFGIASLLSPYQIGVFA